MCAWQVCILDIDIQGVRLVSKAWSTTPPPLYVFIKPVDMATLEDRLRGRVSSHGRRPAPGPSPAAPCACAISLTGADPFCRHCPHAFGLPSDRGTSSVAQGTETDEEVAKRIKTAETEMAFLASAEGQDLMDVVITNDDLETAYAEFKSAIVKVRVPRFCAPF